MKIHQLRNATMLIEINEHHLLIDPMLGKRGAAAPPFTLFRFKARRNPIVNLPNNATQLIDKTTHCLITHLHPDHLDKAGEDFLRLRNIPITCSCKDEKELKSRGLNVVQSLDYWHTTEWLGGKITGIPAVHGYGFVAVPMGNVMGYYIDLPNEKTIYMSSDTVYTPDVHKVLTEWQPAMAVVAAGSAQLDIFQPLLMHMDDIMKFVKNAPHKVLANHLEAVNHCPTTRVALRQTLLANQLADKVFIPADGESIVF
jgi:L-ascorbate metabolism protein UlaG (beta-lactamase superfamily)